MIGPVAFMGNGILYQWIGKTGDVTAGLPQFWILNNSAVDTKYVVVLANHCPPPFLLNVVDQFHA